MADVRRWTASRKAGLVLDVAKGRLPREAVLSLHDLTDEEFASWECRFAVGGQEALKQTKIQVGSRLITLAVPA